MPEVYKSSQAFGGGSLSQKKETSSRSPAIDPTLHGLCFASLRFGVVIAFDQAINQISILSREYEYRLTTQNLANLKIFIYKVKGLLWNNSNTASLINAEADNKIAKS